MAEEKSSSYKVYETYKKDGDSLKKAPNCPKCGPGFRLAVHDNRKSCGKCGYTEFGKKE